MQNTLNTAQFTFLHYFNTIGGRQGIGPRKICPSYHNMISHWQNSDVSSLPMGMLVGSMRENPIIFLLETAPSQGDLNPYLTRFHLQQKAASTNNVRAMHPNLNFCDHNEILWNNTLTNSHMNCKLWLTCWLGNWHRTDVILPAYATISFRMAISTSLGIRPDIIDTSSYIYKPVKCNQPVAKFFLSIKV